MDHQRGGRDAPSGPTKAPPRPRTAAQAKAQERRADRDRRAAARRRWGVARLILAAAVLVLVIVGLVAVYNSSIFAIRRVEVVGAVHLSAEGVRRLAAIPPDATLIRFPADAVAASVSADPWVASVAVTRVFPDAMRIRITERTPVGIVKVGSSAWLIDGGGYVIASVVSTSTLPSVIDVPGLDLKAGRRTTSEPLLNAVRVLAGITPQLLTLVQSVSAPTIDGTTLLTKDKVEIVTGQAVSLEAKSRGALGVLSAQRGRVVAIDVRDPERIVSRGLK